MVRRRGGEDHGDAGDAAHSHPRELARPEVAPERPAPGGRQRVLLTELPGHCPATARPLPGHWQATGRPLAECWQAAGKLLANEPRHGKEKLPKQLGWGSPLCRSAAGLESRGVSPRHTGVTGAQAVTRRRARRWGRGVPDRGATAGTVLRSCVEIFASVYSSETDRVDRALLFRTRPVLAACHQPPALLPAALVRPCAACWDLGAALPCCLSLCHSHE